MDIRVAAYGVIIRDGSMLLSHWNEHGRTGWTLPGGGIDPGEHPADAAVREILEETGYVARLDRLLGIDTQVIPTARRHTQASRPLQALRIVYRASVVSGELRNEIGGSTDEARWVPLDEVSALPTVDLVRVGLRLDADEPPTGTFRRD
ncbi:NUDIX domain-containing protein [Glaciibacter flavus]|uniref:NUDIX domain-containing protein n=2 Tax=Orlajensenia flava TaxID=2565934 RepID=A0A4V3WU10_9MICO|nr:NUDIX domain-containing protein [Glaciibacter flavus]